MKVTGKLEIYKDVGVVGDRQSKSVLAVTDFQI